MQLFSERIRLALHDAFETFAMVILLYIFLIFYVV